MKLADEQYEKAKQIVADIISDYDLKYPINIFDLAEKMGFAVVPYTFYEDNRGKLANYSKDDFNKFMEYEKLKRKFSKIVGKDLFKCEYEVALIDSTLPQDELSFYIGWYTDINDLLDNCEIEGKKIQ